MRYSGLYPMDSAHKDGNPVLLYFVDRIPGDRICDRRWDGKVIVAYHPPVSAIDGFSLGWQMDAPVGSGGFPDSWFKGWIPIPGAGREVAEATEVMHDA